MLLITQLTIIEIANEIDCIAQKCPKKEKTRLIALGWVRDSGVVVVASPKLRRKSGRDQWDAIHKG